MVESNKWISEHRQEWDAQHPKHNVVIIDTRGEIITIPNDNSAMGCSGPMLTPEAVAFLKTQNNLFINIDSIDGIVSDGYGF